MPLIIKKYGEITEITETEKSPSKVCLSGSRKRRDVYGERRLDNIKRSKQICLRRVSSAIKDFGCPLLVTLTFNGDSSDASYANDSIRRFQVRLQTRYNSVESIFVPEISKRGRIHFHGLIFNLPMCIGDQKKGRRIITYGTERSTREIAKLWGEGYVDIRQTNGSRRLGFYLSKYITKAGGEVLFNAMRIIRVSRGIKKEEIYRGQVAEDMQKEYSNEKPVFEWKGENRFQGKIIKKIYEKEDVCDI